MKKDDVDAVVKAVGEIVKEVPVYKDAVQPVAQEIGKALKTVGGVINVALAPFAAMVYGWDIIKKQLNERLEKRLKNIPPENIITPQLQVVGPLLDKYRYVHQNEELSNMFINLLANAMDKDQVQKAHPSFVNIISELSPDEARLIKVIAKTNGIPKLDIRAKDKSKENKGYIYVFVNFTLLGKKSKLQYADLAPSYLSNLERLNIISCPIGEGESYTDKTLYKELEEDEFVTKLREDLKVENQEIEIVQGVIETTDFGKLFIEAVLTTEVES